MDLQNMWSHIPNPDMLDLLVLNKSSMKVPQYEI